MNKKLDTKNIIIAVLGIVVVILAVNQMSKSPTPEGNVPTLSSVPTGTPTTNPPTTNPPTTNPPTTPPPSTPKAPAPVAVSPKPVPVAPKPVEPVVNPDTLSKYVPVTRNIKIQNYSFSPASINAFKGDTIVWTNYDSGLRHIIVGDSPLLAGLFSPTIESGKTYSFVFPRAGTWTYHCKEHPTEKGSVTVVEVK